MASSADTIANRSFARIGVLVVLAGIPMLYLVLLYFLPISDLLALGISTSTYIDVVSNSFYWRILGNTFLFAGEVTLLSLIIGYPVACLACTAGARLSKIILLCATIPLWTSLLARTYAWLAILDRRGLVNVVLQRLHIIEKPLSLSHNTFAALVGSVYIMLPLMVLTLYAPMREIDLSAVRAARTLGARPLQAFVRIFFPLSVPGIVFACLLVFIVSLGFFVTPALLGGPADRTFSMLISQQVDNLGNFAAAAALSMVLLIATIVFLLVFVLTVGFEQFVGGRLGVNVPLSRGYGPAVSRFVGWVAPIFSWAESKIIWYGFVFFVLILLALPYLTLIPMSLSNSEYLQFPPESISLRWYDALFRSQAWLSAGINSVLVGTGAGLLATVMGLVAALGLREVPRATGQWLVVLLIVPAVLPTMIYSVAAYFSEVRVGLVDTPVGLALAHSTLGFPFVVIMCATALSGIRPSIEQAAQSLGARRVKRLFRITIPLIFPSILIGALVAFQTSFDEIVVALFLSGVQTRTLPKAMWQASTLEVTPMIPAVAVIVLVLILVLALVIFGIARVIRPGTHKST